MIAAIYAPGNLPILLDCAQQFSPLIEITSSDLVTFDIRGLGRSIGSPESVLRKIECTIGIPAQIAAASNPDVAIFVATAFPGVTMVPPGREAETLAPLSLHLLGCPAELGQVLDIWGIRTFGQFAQLPPIGVAARLGEEGVYWQQQAQGAVTRQLRLHTEQPRYFKELELEDAVTNLEPLLFLVGRFLFELCVELRARFAATNELRLTLRLNGDTVQFVHLRLPAPMTDQKALLKLVRLELEQQPPSAAIRKVQLELVPVAAKKTQEHLFTASYPVPEHIELTLARVRKIVGAENVGTPELLDSHRPDGFVMRPFVASPRIPENTERDRRLSLALRRYRPPEPAQVQRKERPIHIACRFVKGSIHQARGPWFTSGDWWTQNTWDREEWDISLRNETLYRIFCDLRTQSWFVDGNYD